MNVGVGASNNGDELREERARIATR
jgi:hypothetical protein